MTPTEIARKLTKAQREALVTRPRSNHPAVWGDIELYCSVHRMQTFNALYYSGLIDIGASDTVARLTPLGLAVRAELMKEEG